MSKQEENENRCVRHRYDRDTMLEIAKLPASQRKPKNILDELLISAENEKNGEGRAERWTQGLWLSDGSAQSTTGFRPKGSKTAPIPIGEGENIERLKSENDDGLVLSPQRRSFGAGCQAIIGKHFKQQPSAKDKESRDGGLNGMRGRNQRPQHRSDNNWRDPNFPTKNSREFKSRNFHWSSNQRGNGGDRRSFSSEKNTTLPEWVTEGPKDMFETMELRGFEEEPDKQSDNKEKPMVNGSDESEKAPQPLPTTTIPEPTENENPVATKINDDMPFDIFSNEFMEQFYNGNEFGDITNVKTEAVTGSRFKKFFSSADSETSGGDNSDKRKAEEKQQLCDGPDSTASLGEINAVEAESSSQSVPTIPGAIRLEEIETGLKERGTQSEQTNTILQGLFSAAKLQLRRNEASHLHSCPVEQQPKSNNQSNVESFESGTLKSTLWGTQNAGTCCGSSFESENIFHEGTPNFQDKYKATLRSADVSPAANQQGLAQSSSGSSPQNMPHQRNIPIEVINAMLECQDPSQLGPLSKLLESFTFNGPEPLAWQIFQNQSSGSSDGLTHCQQPGSTTDSSIKLSCTPTTVGRADSSLNNGLERRGNFTPTSVMKQRQQQQQADKSVDSHAAGVLDEQNPLPSGAQYRPITKQSTVCCSPSTSASARDGQASPLMPLVMPPMGTSGSAGHSPLSPQEVARRMQQKRYIHEQMLKHAVYQQQQQQSFGVITPTMPANAVLMNIMRVCSSCATTACNGTSASISS
ncbi:Eukaryotic translation initiation factor 4E transporter [Trichinella spiralis]|uniref:Eukaryotic translation initiation factor 4E transporter n=1 Tax=Trichinella spiralis TaxID=6334 RepID=A0ABR3KBR5_TRISP